MCPPTHNDHSRASVWAFVPIVVAMRAHALCGHSKRTSVLVLVNSFGTRWLVYCGQWSIEIEWEKERTRPIVIRMGQRSIGFPLHFPSQNDPLWYVAMSLTVLWLTDPIIAYKGCGHNMRGRRGLCRSQPSNDRRNGVLRDSPGPEWRREY